MSDWYTENCKTQMFVIGEWIYKIWHFIHRDIIQLQKK